LLDNERLTNQLCNLERRTARGGKDSIDHPPNQHDDIANVVAGVAVGSSKLKFAGTWGAGTTTDSKSRRIDVHRAFPGAATSDITFRGHDLTKVFGPKGESQ
jgi:hypothetical protein